MPLTHSTLPLTAATAFDVTPDAFKFIQLKEMMQFLGMIQGEGSEPK